MAQPSSRVTLVETPTHVGSTLVGSTLIRRVRLVHIAGPARHDGLVDIRLRNGRIQDMAPTVEAETGDHVIDAAGRWAIPGLWDSHVHMLQWSQTLVRLDLAGTSSPEEVVRRVAEHVHTLPSHHGGAVFGFGHRSATWRRPGTVAELDAVSGGRPVVLVSGDGHNGWLSSRALELLGVSGRTGPLDENEWFSVFARLGELPTAGEQEETAYRRAVADAAAKGVVGVTDFEFGRGYLDWPRRVTNGVDQLRVRTCVYPDRLDEVVALGLHTGWRIAGGKGLITMGPLKIISDGSLNTRTAYCCEPYADAAGLDHPRGKQNFTPDELIDLLHRARQHGLDVAVHAIGDAAVSTAVDAFEVTGARGSIEHAQLIARRDARRMAGLGVTASVQPAHLIDDRDVTQACWPDRSGRSFALRSLRDAGVSLAFGSDAPVAPLDPWLAMAAAVHRSGDRREPWHPEEALTSTEALAASTNGQVSLSPGDAGDLVLLDDDPLRDVGDSAAVASHLRSLTVAATFVAGRATHWTL